MPLDRAARYTRASRSRLLCLLENLDDSVKSRSIDVTTNGSTVTLTGTVRSAAERDRAMALARETAGVTSVIDRLTFPR